MLAPVYGGLEPECMADNVNRLLIVEEDAAVVDLVGKVAKRVGYAIASATSGAALRAVARVVSTVVGDAWSFVCPTPTASSS